MESLENLSQVFQKTDGVDKFLKVMQYSIRISLWDGRPSALADKLDRVQKDISSSRTVLRLLKFTFYVKDLRNQWPGSFKDFEARTAIQKVEFINNVMGCVTDFCDDVQWLSRMGFVSQKMAIRVEEVAQRLWFFTVLMDLFLSTCQLKKTKGPKQRLLAMLLVSKFVVEFVQSGRQVIPLFDLFVSKRSASLCALFSAVFSFTRLYLKQLNTIS